MDSLECVIQQLDARTKNYERQKRQERRSNNSRPVGGTPKSDAGLRKPSDSFRSPLRTRAYEEDDNCCKHRNTQRGNRRTGGKRPGDSRDSVRSCQNWRYQSQDFPNLEGSTSSEFLTPPTTKPAKKDWNDMMENEEDGSQADAMGILTPDDTPKQTSWAQVATPPSSRCGRAEQRLPSQPRVSKRKLLLSGSSSGYSSSGDNAENASQAESNPKEFENDPQTLVRRQKQIDYGKNTVGYQLYTEKVPREKRSKEDPNTPKKYIKYSRRSWDTQVRLWRQHLHKWDTKATKDAEKETISGFDFDMSDLILDPASDITFEAID